LRSFLANGRNPAPREILAKLAGLGAVLTLVIGIIADMADKIDFYRFSTGSETEREGVRIVLGVAKLAGLGAVLTLVIGIIARYWMKLTQ
jgi:hypothetical protein